MYSGIIHSYVSVNSIDRKVGLISISVSLPPGLKDNLSLGSSIALDGVCLTVTSVADNKVTFDVMNETLQVTTLGALQERDAVNIERSLKGGEEIGGHLVSGHVDGQARIVEISRPDENNVTFVLELSKQWLKYIFPKGFIALNGASLTVGAVDREKNRFSVYLIPETLRRTTFGLKQVGDFVNFEIERQTQVIVDTINNFLETNREQILANLQ